MCSVIYMLLASFPALQFGSGDVAKDVDPGTIARLADPHVAQGRRLDSYEQLMKVASEQLADSEGNVITSCHGECWELNRKYVPLNMVDQTRTVEESPKACQKRCKEVVGCAHFSFWVNGGCHLQDENATGAAPTEEDGGYTELAGPPECPPMNNEQKELADSGKCTATTTTSPAAATVEEEDNLALIVGIIIACCAVLLLCCIVALLLLRRRPKKEPSPPPMLEDNIAETAPTPAKEAPPAREESESTII